jgi:hypothetical protein
MQLQIKANQFLQTTVAQCPSAVVGVTLQSQQKLSTTKNLSALWTRRDEGLRQEPVEG